MFGVVVVVVVAVVVLFCFIFGLISPRSETKIRHPWTTALHIHKRGQVRSGN